MQILPSSRTDEFKVFTIVASLWAQVEHSAGQLMPWYLMSRSQASAENSVLLNYLTPLRIVSLWRSLKRSHWLVSISTSGSLILGLLIILSTSLLSLEHRPITKIFTKEGGFTTLDQFNLTKAPPEQDENGFFQSPGYSISNTWYYWGMHKHNVPRPSGMTSEYAFQTFKVPDIGKPHKSFFASDGELLMLRRPGPLQYYDY